MDDSTPDRLRTPAYTGANRCYPCTAVNVALVGLVAAAVAGVSVPLSAAVAGLGLAAVWLRGYVVPGTPRLTRRYLPDRLLAAFGKSPLRRGGFAPPNGSVPEAGDPTDSLAALGALDPDDASLTAAFEASWSATAARLAGDETAIRTAAAEALDAEPNRIDSAVAATGGVTLTLDDEWVGDWPSRTALVADLAAELVLSGDAWTDLDRVTRADLTARLRGLATACPVCGGDTTVSDDTVESCCRSAAVVAVTCDGCGDRLAEFERSVAAFTPGS